MKTALVCGAGGFIGSHMVKRLKKEGFIFISEEPKEGADNKLVVFLHPKSTNGVLIELCQEKP